MIAAMAIAFASGATARAATMSATLDRDTIYEGETAEVSVAVQNAKGDEEPVAPVVANLAIQASPGTETSTVIVNGVFTYSRVYRYAIEPKATGDYTIPPFTLDLDGVTLSTRALRLRVLSGQNPAISQIAFLQLKPAKQRIYVGEGLPVEVGVAYRGGEYRQAPQLEQEGLTMGPMEQLQPRVERAGGVEFRVDPFRTYVVAARAGNLKLGPATLAFGIPVRSRLGIFGRELMPVKLMSPVLDLQVLSLPGEGVPKSFTGAVGRYAMNVEISTNAVTGGDPILITVEISGEGPIESLRIESIGDWKGFKTYAPETSVALKDKLGLSGTKRFTQVVLPDGPEVKELPPVQFSYFDPDRKSYQTLSHGPTPITVRPGATITASPSIPGRTEQQTGEVAEVREIVHIKSRLGNVGTIQPPLVLRPWFLVLEGVPLATWLGLLTWRWRKAKVAADPRLRRRKRVARAIREGMAELHRAAEQDEPETFFATLFRMLQERLGEKTGLPASANDELCLDDHLKGKIDEELLAEIHGLFQSCNVARYAPGRLGEGLPAFIPRLKSVLDRLDRMESA